jgi:Ca2+-binding RTX toxin-like protein
MAAGRYKNPSRDSNRWLKVERLERRELLTVLLDADILRVTGTDNADAATIDPFTQNGEQWVAATLNGQSSQYAASAIRKIVFVGNDGDDSFVNNSDLPSYAWGNAGVDTLIGGGGADRLYGGTWGDSLAGGAGNDSLFGDAADDTIYGGAGDDAIFGQSGSDALYGEDGNDSILASSGNDTIFGGEGDDYLHGHTGFDEIYGGNGDDFIVGHAADDWISAGGGDDRVYGGGQNDTIFGEGGNDYLFGTAGENWISGGDGNDRVYGGLGNDYLMGNDGDDRIRAYDGDDTLLGHAGADVLFGSEGNDTLYGGDDDDYLCGDGGDDNLYGGSGSDQLFGEDGNDGLFGGGAEADYLSGGAGSDRFLTQTGDSIQDQDASDAQLMFVNGTSPYTDLPRDWTDADVEKTDKSLILLHRQAGSALILKDTYTNIPVKLYVADSFNLGANVAGFNWFNGSERQIHVRGNLSNESFGATIVHEFGHNWDSTGEGHQGWTAFDSLHSQSSTSSDYSRSYGQTNAREDWATNWELFFGYYEWAAPAVPSSILLQKQAAVQNFFANFAAGVS